MDGTKTWFIGNINKIDKTLARLIRKKKRPHKLAIFEMR